MKTKLTYLMLTILFCGGIIAQNKKVKKNKKAKNEKTITMKTELDTLSYSIGVSIMQSMQAQGLKSLNQEAFIKAMNDVMEGKALLY